MEQSHSHIIPHERAIEFMTAGNSIFTLKNTAKGTRFTYKCFLTEQLDVIKVGLLTGNDNTVFSPMATIIKDASGMPIIKKSSKSWISEEAPALVAFRFVFYNLLVGREMPTLEIWHEGRCCRCGRTLTVPESIALGIGPECITKVNKFQL